MSDDYSNFNLGYGGEERITDGELLPTDENENILRPTTLDEYVGQRIRRAGQDKGKPARIYSRSQSQRRSVRSRFVVRTSRTRQNYAKQNHS